MRFTSFFLAAALVICTTTVKAQNAADTIKKGDEFFKKEKFSPAINYYTKAISIDPKSYEAFYKRGVTYSTIRENNKALQDYTDAISLAPADPAYKSLLYTERGNAYKTKKRYDSAQLDFNKALSLDPGNANACSGRGDLYYQKNSFDSALADYTKAINLDAGIAESYRKRSKAYYCRNQADSALNDMLTVMRFDADILNYNYRGLYYNSLGNYESAVKDFLHHLKNNFKYGNAYINIISPLVRLQRFAEASVFYSLFQDRLYLAGVLATRGISLSFDSFLDQAEYKFYNYYIKAVTEVSDGRLNDALTSLDTASKKYGSEIKNLTKRCYIDILHLRGYILEKLGQTDDAKANYEQSLVIDPRQPDVEKALDDLAYKTSLARSKTRSIDKTGPVIKGAYADTVKVMNVSQSILSDSLTIKIRGTASDESGIRQLKVNNVIVDNVEEDGFFHFNLRKKSGDNSPILIAATDSAGNTGTYTISNAVTRGGEVGNTSAAPDAPMGKYYAILIAEKDYTDPDFKDLSFPVRDANRLKEILQNQYTFEADNIDTLYNRSREDILETIIARCKALGKNDNLLIFYAGHGDTTHDKDNRVDGYLIPTSAKKGLTSYFITSEEIKKALLKSNAQHILLLLDACYSGTFTRGGFPDATGDVWVQWKSPSRKVMTSGNLEAVPDVSFFIRYLTEVLRGNTQKYLSAKDVWDFVDKGIRDHTTETDRTKYYNPQYSAITGVDDKGGSFIFVLRK